MFTSPQVATVVNDSRAYCASDAPKLLCYLNANKPLEYLRIMVNRYSDIFSLNHLFLHGEQERYVSIENFGLLPFVLIPFYLAGLISIARKQKNDLKEYFQLFLLTGLFISSFPSALLPSLPIRTQMSAVYPFIFILLVYGISVLDSKLKIKFQRPILLLSLAFIGFVYLFNYVHIHNKKYADNWEYIQKLMLYISQQNSKTKIYLKPFIGESLTYYAFFAKIPPTEYQKSVRLGTTSSEGFQHVVGVKNVDIYDTGYQSAACETKDSADKILYVTDENLNNVSDHEVKPLYVGASTSGLANLAYVYNAKDLLSAKTTCK